MNTGHFLHSPPLLFLNVTRRISCRPPFTPEQTALFLIPSTQRYRSVTQLPKVWCLPLRGLWGKVRNKERLASSGGKEIQVV